MKYIISFTLRTVTNYTDGNIYSYINHKFKYTIKSEATKMWKELNNDGDYSNLMRNF